MKCATCSAPAVQATQQIQTVNKIVTRDIAIQCSLDFDENKSDAKIIQSFGSTKTGLDKIQQSTANLSAIFFTIGSDNRPHVVTEVRGKKVVALVDTGAQVSVIGTNQMKNINDWGDQLRPCNLILHMADKSGQRPLGQIDIEYSLNGINATVPTVVLNGPPDMLILGVDFQRKFNIGITDEFRKMDLFDFDPSVDIKVVNTSESEQSIQLGSVNEKGDAMRSIFPSLDVCSFVVKDSRTEHSETDDIFKNRLITSEDPLDLEPDIDVPKAFPVSIPHVLEQYQQARLNKVVAMFVPTPETGPLNQTNAIIQ